MKEHAIRSFLVVLASDTDPDAAESLKHALITFKGVADVIANVADSAEIVELSRASSAALECVKEAHKAMKAAESASRAAEQCIYSAELLASRGNGRPHA